MPNDTSPSLPAATSAENAAPIGASTPTDELNKKRKDESNNKDVIEKTTKDSASNQLDIAMLTTGIIEIEQLITAFKQDVKTPADLNDFDKFVAQEQTMADCAVGDKKTALDKIINDKADKIKGQQKKCDDAATVNKKAADDLATSQTAAADAKAKYDRSKGTLSRLQAGAADLKSLKTQITAANDARQVNILYFLVEEMHLGLSTLGPRPTKEELQSDLNTALLALQKAQSDLRTQQQQLDKAKADLAGAQKDLDDMVKGRRAYLLAEFSTWSPKESPPAQPLTPAKV